VRARTVNITVSGGEVEPELRRRLEPHSGAACGIGIGIVIGIVIRRRREGVEAGDDGRRRQRERRLNMYLMMRNIIIVTILVGRGIEDDSFVVAKGKVGHAIKSQVSLVVDPTEMLLYILHSQSYIFLNIFIYNSQPQLDATYALIT